VQLCSVAEEVIKKRYKEDPTGTQSDMLGSFMRHGVKEFDAVAEGLLQMYATTPLTLTFSLVADIQQPRGCRHYRHSHSSNYALCHDECARLPTLTNGS